MQIEPLNPRQWKILVVDDEPGICASFVKVMTLEGYIVHGAASGDEAMALLAEIPFDLMILDIRMPGMSGVEVMETAGKLYPDLQTIILTGYATFDSAITALKTHAVDYLLKPVDTYELVDLVRRTLEARVQALRQKKLAALINGVVDDWRVIDIADRKISADDKRYRQIDDLVLDIEKGVVFSSNNVVGIETLTDGEAAILTGLMTHVNQILSCSELVKSGWNYTMWEQEAQGIVRPHISRLRRKIARVIPGKKFIHTVRKRGYVLKSPNA